MINNIVSNSEKYMDKEHGKINLRVKDVGDFVQIELEDNGKGIREKELPHIFYRFLIGQMHREIPLREEVESVFRL